MSLGTCLESSGIQALLKCDGTGGSSQAPLFRGVERIRWQIQVTLHSALQRPLSEPWWAAKNATKTTMTVVLVFCLLMESGQNWEPFQVLSKLATLAPDTLLFACN